MKWMMQCVTFAAICLLLSCGQAAPPPPAAVDLIPQFGYAASTRSVRGATKVVLPQDSTSNAAKLIYYTFTPIISGWQANSDTSLVPGSSFSQSFFGDTITVNITETNGKIIYAGSDTLGTISLTITYDPVAKTFDYSQSVVFSSPPQPSWTDQHTAYAYVHIEFSGAQLNENTTFQTIYNYCYY